MQFRAIVLIAALIAAAYAQTSVTVFTIYSDSACSDNKLIGMVSDIGTEIGSCTGVLCEQIGTTGQYKRTACLSAAGTPPANFAQWNAFGTNQCQTATNLTALTTGQCVLVRDNAALKVTACASGKFTMTQATSLADCNGNKGVTFEIDPAACTDIGDGKTFAKGVCGTAAPGKANSATMVATLSVASVAAGLALVL